MPSLLSSFFSSALTIDTQEGHTGRFLDVQNSFRKDGHFSMYTSFLAGKAAMFEESSSGMCHGSLHFLCDVKRTPRVASSLLDVRSDGFSDSPAGGMRTLQQIVGSKRRIHQGATAFPNTDADDGEAGPIQQSEDRTTQQEEHSEPLGESDSARGSHESRESEQAKVTKPVDREDVDEEVDSHDSPPKPKEVVEPVDHASVEDVSPSSQDVEGGSEDPYHVKEADQAKYDEEWPKAIEHFHAAEMGRYKVHRD